MLLNAVEFALMNSRFRALVQRYVEAPALLHLGGPMAGGRALEIGCGPGAGAEIIAEVFAAGLIEGVDLDERMVARARERAGLDGRMAFSSGDVTRLHYADGTFDAVFDFGILHHVPDWQTALNEVARVLRPGGRFYAEEAFRDLIDHPLSRRLFVHPRHDRFDHDEFVSGMRSAGFDRIRSEVLGRMFGWYTAVKREQAKPELQ